MIKKNVENFLSLLGEGIDQGGFGNFLFFKKKMGERGHGFYFLLVLGSEEGCRDGFPALAALLLVERVQTMVLAGREGADDGLGRSRGRGTVLLFSTVIIN
jgi:hypothetical protein